MEDPGLPIRIHKLPGGADGHHDDVSYGRIG